MSNDVLGGDKHPENPASVDANDAKSSADSKKTDSKESEAKEYGGGKGPNPTRYGDWEIGGKCVDF